jgi:hypothetical protein
VERAGSKVDELVDDAASCNEPTGELVAERSVSLTHPAIATAPGPRSCDARAQHAAGTALRQDGPAVWKCAGRTFSTFDGRLLIFRAAPSHSEP